MENISISFEKLIKLLLMAGTFGVVIGFITGLAIGLTF